MLTDRYKNGIFLHFRTLKVETESATKFSFIHLTFLAFSDKHHFKRLLSCMLIFSNFFMPVM